MISEQDYNEYKAGVITPAQLAQRDNISLQCAYKHLRQFKGNKNLYPEATKQALRAELAQTVPYDKSQSIKAVLVRYNLTSLAHALQVLKTTLNEIRGLSPETSAVLKAHKLKLTNGVLYSPAHRGYYHTDRQIVLSRDDQEELNATPREWINKNLDRITDICFTTHRQRLKTENNDISKRLINKYTKIRDTKILLSRHHTNREITHLLGTNKYVTLAKKDLKTVFTDQELAQLKKGGYLNDEE